MDRERFEAAPTFEEFLETVDRNRELWNAVHERVTLPEDLVNEARRLPGSWHLLVIAEDWCGDAVNTVPAVARLADEVGWDLRVVSREDNADLMDTHLTNGRSRSIPVVIVYDDRFGEVGWWGPRPGELQRWVLTEGLAMPSPERYKVVRRWYARDRARTTLDELVNVVREAA